MNVKWIITLTLIAAVFLFSIENRFRPAQLFGADTRPKTGPEEKLHGQMKAEKNGADTTLSSIVGQETLIALNNWVLNDKEYICVITQVNAGSDFGSTRRLSCYEKKREKLVTRYSYETTDWFLSMYPLKDLNGNLLTIWGGGSAYHFLVLSVVNGEIKIVLKAGSYSMPEIVDVDNDGESEILITEGKLMANGKGGRIISYPQSATLYRWNGNSYQTAWTRSWKDRFKNAGKR